MSGIRASAIRALLPWVTMTLLFWLSSRTASGLPTIRLFPHADKCIHAFLYALLFCSWLPLARRHRLGGFLGAAAAALCCALADEWHQSQVPGRTPDVADVGADVVGIAVAWWGCRWALRGESRILRRELSVCSSGHQPPAAGVQTQQ